MLNQGIASQLCLAVAFAAGLTDAGLLDKRQTSVPAGYSSRPYYPAPFGGWVDEWAESYEKARELVDSMTLAEKTNITAGTGIFMGALPILRNSLMPKPD
jgi:hypothetical protein